MSPRINLFGLPNRTTLIFVLIVLLCLGIFLPSLPSFIPALFFLLAIPLIALRELLSSYERMRGYWKPCDLAETHPLLAQRIRAIAAELKLSPRLELWCTADSRAVVHAIGTFRRQALVLWSVLADSFEAAYRHPAPPDDAQGLSLAYIVSVLDEELADLTSFWQRGPVALLNHLLQRTGKARTYWKPARLEDTHPRLAEAIRSLARPAGLGPQLELWCTTNPSSALHSFRTLGTQVLILSRALADQFELAVERDEREPAMTGAQADAVLYHELAHLRNRDAPLVMAAHSLTRALLFFSLFYLVSNSIGGYFFLQVPRVLDTMIRNGQHSLPQLAERYNMTISEALYEVSWGTGDGERGLGLLRSDVLSVGTYGCEVASYEVLPDGVLEGLWGERGQMQLGTERAVPTAGSAGDIVGTYTITGTFSDKRAYTGTLAIERRGEVYRFEWKLGETITKGIGVLQRGIVSVGWGQGKRCGVAAYLVGPDGRLTGLVAVDGQDRAERNQALRSR